MIEVNVHGDTADKLASGTINLTTTNITQVITRTGLSPDKGVQFKAGLDNAGVVYVGDAFITSNVAEEYCGFPLDAGESVFLPVSDVTILYAKAGTANDKLHWVVL